MKLVYAVSQKTNSKRLAACHIDNGEGKPLCGGNGREPFFWAPEEGEPTCKICIDLAMMIEGEAENGNAEQEKGI
jgi:hypothetical protein